MTGKETSVAVISIAVTTHQWLGADLPAGHLHGTTVAYSVCGLQGGDSVLYMFVRNFLFIISFVPQAFCFDFVIQSLQPYNCFFIEIKVLNYLLKT